MSNNFKAIEDIFHQVVESPKEQQLELTQALAKGDQDLIDSVIQLLESDNKQKVNSILELTAASLITENDPWIGKTIDSYLIKSLIERGGMGSVYLAERNDDNFTHYVAIKFISSTFSAKALSRFKVERQILASLNHPNIGKLLNGGKTSNNTPYLIMEFITGQPIDKYSKSNHLSLKQRLKLFIKVCNGIQFAHDNLIIHRDIKANNVLIDHLGEPKIIDFGIAKVLTESAASTDPKTQTQHRSLTPNYASPEQVTGKSQSFATDVYGLGVLLYKLLCDSYPFELASSKKQSFEYIICQQPPKKVSTVFSQKRKTLDTAEFPFNHKQLSGSLDNIINKALQKSPQQRYATVTEFAEDINRYLTNRPVLAKPPSAIERTHKFILRNKWPVATATLFTLVISSTIIFYTVQLKQQRDIAIEQRRLSEQRADELEATTQFITSIFSTANPREKGSANTTALDLLNVALKTIDQKLPAASTSKARLLFNIGLAYKGLKKSDLAIEAFTMSHETYLAAEGYESEDAIRSLHRLGDSLRQNGDNQRAYELLSYTVKRRQEIHQGPHPDIADGLNNLAICLRNLKRFDEAIEVQQQSIAMHQQVSPQASLHIPYKNLAQMYREKRENFTANELTNKAIKEFYEKGDQSDLGGFINVLHFSGMLKNRMGLYDDAIVNLTESLKMSAGKYDENSHTILLKKRELAQALHGSGKLKQAKLLFTEILATCKKACTSKYMIAMIEKYYGLLLSSKGEHEKAIQQIDSAIKFYVDVLSVENRSTLQALLNQAEIYRDAGKETEFLAFMEKLEMFISNNSKLTPFYINSHRLIMAEHYLNKSSPERAAELISGLAEYFIADNGDQSPQYKRVLKVQSELKNSTS